MSTIPVRRKATRNSENWTFFSLVFIACKYTGKSVSKKDTDMPCLAHPERMAAEAAQSPMNFDILFILSLLFI